MNIKNVLVIAVTLLSVTTIANAETIINNTTTDSQAEYSSVSPSGFSLGFQSSGKAAKIAKQEANVLAKKDNKSKALVLGFNGPANAPIKETNVLANTETYNENVKRVNKVADSFNIGFNI